MKKIIVSLAMAAALLAGCQKSEMVDPLESVESVKPVAKQFVATVEDYDSDTKTSMDSNKNVLWSKGDRIAIFDGSSLGVEYVLADECEGKQNGVFNRVDASFSGDVFYAGTEIPCIIGLYPYSSGLSVGVAGAESYDVKNMHIPASQAYAASSFGQGAFPMIAFSDVKEDAYLHFKNILGAIKLQFKGKTWIKSVSIEGKNGEILSGPAVVTAYVNNQKPKISMIGTADDDKSVVLECAEYVRLSMEEATEFILALPPVTFSAGFNVTVTDIYGNVQVVESTVSNEICRSSILVMPEVEVTFDYPEEPDFDITLSVENETAGVNPQLPQFEKMNISVAYSDDYTPAMSLWVSSDPSMLTVTPCEGGAVVEAVYDGMMTDDEKKSVTITHYAGTKSTTKTIDITRAVPKSVEFVGLPENNTLYLGERFGPDFGVKVYPVQASQHVAFTVEKDSPIGNIVNGSGYADKTGCFVLTATTRYIPGWGEAVATVYITVKARLVEGGVLSNSTLSLGEGESATLLIDFTPANNENYDYTVVWETSDAAVVTVDKGKVTAVSEGTATITATLSNGDKLTCEVTVQKPSAAEVAVGDYYYSDGTWSTELDPSKTVIGAVFSVENPSQMGDSKLSADHPQATHGLVVALEETASIQWQASSSNVGQWLVDNNGYNYLKDTGRKCGYSNTLGLVAYNAACAPENKVLVADCAPEIELGSKTSGWYLPSYAELDMLFKYEQSTRLSMISNGAIAQKIEAAGGTPFSIERSSYNTPDGMDDAPTYWSSTESSGSSTWATGVHFLYGGVTNKSKTGKSYYIARYVFAF